MKHIIPFKKNKVDLHARTHKRINIYQNALPSTPFEFHLKHSTTNNIDKIESVVNKSTLGENF